MVFKKLTTDLFGADFDWWHFGNYVLDLAPSSPKTIPTTPSSPLLFHLIESASHFSPARH